MTKDIWVNLPVKNIAKSATFFKEMGFVENDRFPANDTSASFFIGEKKFILMLFTAEMITEFANHPVSDPSKGIEVLFSLDAESREEVDEMLAKAEKAGGKIYAYGGEKDGWMYGGGFVDLDGHRWSLLYMDFSKMG